MTEAHAIVHETTGPPTHVVGIGASAGGLEAVSALFEALPSTTGMAFVVIQHLSPEHESLMAGQLGRRTTMPTVTVDDRVSMQADTVYLIGPGTVLTVDGPDLVSRERPKDEHLSLPVNTFFHSLAREWGDRSVVAVLSGMGTDGTAGVMDVRDAGGLVLAQDESTAAFSAMPASAVATGCVDLVESPEGIAGILMRYCDRQSRLKATNPLDPEPHEGLPAVFDALHRAYDIDFNDYKPQTVKRRIQRRISLSSNPLSLAEYGRRVQRDPQELDDLYKDLLIGVTRFYRDPEAFEALAQDVVPGIVEGLAPDEEARIWVCGCSTGEEAYSVAILFLEAFEKRGVEPRLKLLATDLHRTSLRRAADGRYPVSALIDVPGDLREKYFMPDGEGFVKVTPRLRKPIVFSEHNLLKDPPFTRMDLITCRNLLIYFNARAQARALTFFLFSLNVHGHLLLGASEGLGDFAREFDTINQKWKVFRKERETHSPIGVRTRSAFGGAPEVMGASVAPQRTYLGRLYDALLDRYVPAGILVNDRREAVHVFGDAHRYLHPPSGRVTNQLYDMTDGRLRSTIMSALRSAEQSGRSTTIRGTLVDLQNDPGHSVDVTVDPIVSARVADALYMILLAEPTPWHASDAHDDADTGDDVASVDSATHPRIQQLEEELQQTRASLEQTVEQLATSNEELQATNEELLAANEELQSTNEELQSTNEELYSVNAEHELKIDQLDAATNHINNLIRSTHIATIFVTKQFRVQLFTPEAATIFPFVESDVGRSLRDFRADVSDPDLFDDLATVMESGEVRERTLSSADGPIYVRRASPYRTADGSAIDGAAITYVDVSESTRMASELADARQQVDVSEAHLRRAQAVAHLGSWTWNIPDDTIVFSDEGHRVFGYEPGRGPDSFDAFVSTIADKDRDRVTSAVRLTLEGGAPYDIDYDILHPDGSLRTIEAQGQVDFGDGGDPLRMIGTVVDVTEQRRTERALTELAERLRKASEAKTVFLATVSHEFRTPLNGILGMTHLLKGSSLDDDQRKRVDAIWRASTSLRDLVSGVLDITRIEEGELVLQSEPFTLETLNDELDEAFADRAASEGLTLRFGDLPSEAPAVLSGDYGRLRQMASNLIDNALKYTDEGRVDVTWSVDKGDADSVHLRCSVADTGPGIPEGYEDAIFDLFEQGVAGTATASGVGMGLAIVKELSTRMGGTAGFTARPSGGSVFWFDVRVGVSSLPADIAMDERAARGTNGSAASLRGARVMIVDDNGMNREVAARLLESEGADVRAFSGGLGALGALTAEGAVPDVLLTDLHMPGMDGYELAQRVRAIDGCSDLPIVALTAVAFESERSKVEEAGFDDFLTKPIDPVSLFQRLRHFVPVRTMLPPTHVAGASPAVGPSDDWPGIAGVDTTRARAQLSGDRDLFEDLLLDYRTDSPPLVSEVSELLAGDRWTEAADALHKLRGQAASIAASETVACIIALEDAVGTEEPTAEKLTALRAAQERLITAIEAWRRGAEGTAPRDDRP